MSQMLEKEYGQLYKEVRRIINDDDPVRLKGRIPLESEYDPEIAAILSELKGCRSLDEVQRLIHRIFLQKFDQAVAGSAKRYRGIAERIFALIEIGSFENRRD